MSLVISASEISKRSLTKLSVYCWTFAV